MRFKIQEFDVHVETMDVRWVYFGVIEGAWKWAAQKKLESLKRQHPEYDVIKEPEWMNLESKRLHGYFYEEDQMWKGQKYPHPKGYWVAVHLRSATGLPEKGFDFTEYSCILFLEDFTTDNLIAELQKIEWSKVCKDGDIT
jgi:hypothetical protein